MGDFTTAGEVESVTAHEVINSISTGRGFRWRYSQESSYGVVFSGEKDYVVSSRKKNSRKQNDQMDVPVAVFAYKEETATNLSMAAAN